MAMSSHNDCTKSEVLSMVHKVLHSLESCLLLRFYLLLLSARSNLLQTHCLNKVVKFQLRTFVNATSSSRMLFQEIFFLWSASCLCPHFIQASTVRSRGVLISFTTLYKYLEHCLAHSKHSVMCLR